MPRVLFSVAVEGLALRACTLCSPFSGVRQRPSPCRGVGQRPTSSDLPISQSANFPLCPLCRFVFFVVKSWQTFAFFASLYVFVEDFLRYR